MSELAVGSLLGSKEIESFADEEEENLISFKPH